VFGNAAAGHITLVNLDGTVLHTLDPVLARASVASL
jgi:hypothetical protein